MLTVAFFGQTGPYSPNVLRALLEAQHRRNFQLCVVVQGRKPSGAGRQHRLLVPRASQRRQNLPLGDSLPNIAYAAGKPLIQTTDANHPWVAEQLQDYSPDILVCAGFSHLFNTRLLGCFPRGGINAHPSALPLWRGPCPIFWALRSGAEQLGVTLHRMTSRADAGAILAQSTLSLPFLASGEDIYQLAGQCAGRLLPPVLADLDAALENGQPQDDTNASLAPRPSESDARIEPEAWNARTLANFASAAAFFRPLWIERGVQRFTIRRAIRVLPGSTMPADIVQQDHVITVPCKDGLVRFEIYDDVTR